MKAIIFAKKSLRLIAYISDEDKFIDAVPKGNLKKLIMVGDLIEGNIIDDKILIKKIIPRKNKLFRPKLSNISQIFLVFSLKEPKLNIFNLDRLLSIYTHLNVNPAILFNKIDLLDNNEKKELDKITNYYNKIGYKTIQISAKTSIENLKSYFLKGINLLAGQSGVGKSTIITSLTGKEIDTQEISQKIKRGKNTTIDTRLYKIDKNIFIGDTPGFSEIYPHLIMDNNQLKDSFLEFRNHSCKFDNCNHLNEPDCDIKKLVEKNKILKSRYENYITIYNEIKSKKKW